MLSRLLSSSLIVRKFHQQRTFFSHAATCSEWYHVAPVLVPSMISTIGMGWMYMRTKQLDHKVKALEETNMQLSKEQQHLHEKTLSLVQYKHNMLLDMIMEQEKETQKEKTQKGK